jgi:hypothetical protein
MQRQSSCCCVREFWGQLGILLWMGPAYEEDPVAFPIDALVIYLTKED